MPIIAWEGMSAIAVVERPISMRVAMRAGRRPCLSPMWPKTIAPIGRATKPTPKVASDRSSDVDSEAVGKNTWPKTRAAAAP